MIPAGPVCERGRRAETRRIPPALAPWPARLSSPKTSKIASGVRPLDRRPLLCDVLLKNLSEDPLEIFQRSCQPRPSRHGDLVDDGPTLRVALDQAAVGELLESGIDGTGVRLVAPALPDLAGEGLSVHRT